MTTWKSAVFWSVLDFSYLNYVHASAPCRRTQTIVQMMNNIAAKSDWRHNRINDRT